jgi:hypothetical protein
MDVSGQLQTPGSFTPGERDTVPTGQDSGWDSGLVCRLWRREEIPTSDGNRTLIVRPVGRTGCWRKLHNEDLHDLYSSSNIILGFKLLLLHTENGGSMSIRNVGIPSHLYTASQPRGPWPESCSCFLTNILYVCLISFMRATCPDLLILLISSK